MLRALQVKNGATMVARGRQAQSDIDARHAEFIEAVMKDGLSATEKMVLIVLAYESRAWDWKEFQATHKYIGGRASVNVSTVKRLMGALASAGWVTVTAGAHSDGGRAANSYALHIPAKVAA